MKKSTGVSMYESEICLLCNPFTWCIPLYVLLYCIYCIWLEHQDLHYNVRALVKPCAFGPNVLVTRHACTIYIFDYISLCVSSFINKSLRTELNLIHLHYMP